MPSKNQYEERTLFFTGVGSRKAGTREDLIRIGTICRKMVAFGGVLRSGGATGADTIFETAHEYFLRIDKYGGCIPNHRRSEIYTPWAGYYSDCCDDSDVIDLESVDVGLVHTAYEIAKSIHPAWGSLSEGGRKLHARNVLQVLGKDLKTPSALLVCVAPTNDPRRRGVPVGGTRTAWKVAELHGIDCYNISIDSHYRSLLNFLDFFL